MPASHLIILLSIGSFQAVVPEVSKLPSPVFQDTSEGVKAFTTWATTTLPTPKFAQPPLQVCVVGAVHFTPDKAPYLTRPLYLSQRPLRALEPYAATFHYVDLVAGAKPPRPRTLKQALEICGQSKPKRSGS